MGVLKHVCAVADRLIENVAKDLELTALGLNGQTIRHSVYQRALSTLDEDYRRAVKANKAHTAQEEEPGLAARGHDLAVPGDALRVEVIVPAFDRQLIARKKVLAELPEPVDYDFVAWEGE